MIILITVATTILYIILIAFTWHNINSILEMKKKLMFFVISLVLMLVATFIAFTISSAGIRYDSPDMIKNVRLIMLAVFTPVNGMIVMPYLASVVSKIYTHDITQEKVRKRLIIISIIFIIVIIFECSYFRTTQLGILNLINHM